MYDECPKCGYQIPLKREPSKCGALEFSAKCPCCGNEYGGFILSAPSEPPNPENEDSTTLKTQ